MKRIYLIRHGECPGQGTYVGRRTNFSLNEEGKESITTLAITLRKEGIRPNKIITSQLKRARESGRILGAEFDRSPPILEDPRIDEIDFGEWEGLTYREICRDFPKESQLWVKDNWEISPPGGESSRQMADRITEFYHWLLSSQLREEGDIFIVGHGGSLRMLLCLFMGISPRNQWQFRIDRSGVAGIELCGDLPVIFRLQT